MNQRNGTLLVGGGIAAAIAIAWLALAGDASDPTTPEAATLDFETVQTRDLEEIAALEGTLGFPEGESVPSRLRGTITTVAAAGSVVTEGDVLFAVDGEPVVLLLGTAPAYRAIGPEPIARAVAAGSPGVVTAIVPDGAVLSAGDEVLRINDQPLMLLPGELPAWRTLRIGVEGRDVAQLEAALVALGYDPNGTVTVDEYFGSTTAAMVARWQEAVGTTADGRLGLEDAVFFPGDVVVTGRNAVVGSPVNSATAVLTVVAGSEPIAGSDVLQLQQALVRLGYESPTSGVFDAATGAAVSAWQADIGAVVDGTVDLGEVVFLPAPVRITEALISVGRPVTDGSSVLATTASASVVQVDLPAADQSLLTVDQEVTVVMPDDTEVAAVVTAISGIATRLTGGDVVFETTIRLIDATVGAELDQAPVDVLVVTDARTGVLAVPVTALLALAEGGYAVEVDNGDGSTRLVGVEPGLYADGWVEVAGNLSPGDRVVVP